MIVLSVVLPETHRADFESSPRVQRLIATARTAVCLRRLPWLRDVGEHVHTANDQRLMTVLSKLLQKPHIPLKEILNIIHSILQQRQPVHAHPEGESGNFLRVVPVVLHELKHIRINHPASEHLNPSRLLAWTARSILRPALPTATTDEAGDIQLRAGLGEREERRPEMRL